MPGANYWFGTPSTQIDVLSLLLNLSHLAGYQAVLLPERQWEIYQTADHSNLRRLVSTMGANIIVAK